MFCELYSTKPKGILADLKKAITRKEVVFLRSKTKNSLAIID